MITVSIKWKDGTTSFSKYLSPVGFGWFLEEKKDAIKSFRIIRKEAI